MCFKSIGFRGLEEYCNCISRKRAMCFLKALQTWYAEVLYGYLVSSSKSNENFVGLLVWNPESAAKKFIL